MIYQEVEDETRPTKKSRLTDIYENDVNHLQHLKPLGFSASRVIIKTTNDISVPESAAVTRKKTLAESRQEIQEVIEAASRAAAEAQKAAEEAAKVGQTQKAESRPNSTRSSSRKETIEEREARREKKLLKLVGAIVVKCMSKHQKRMDHDIVN